MSRPLSHALKDILDLHQERFPAVRKSMEFPVQDPLFDLGKRIHHGTMGRFYEYLTAALFGGRVSAADRTDLEGDADGCQVDVVETKKKTFRESKACRSGHHLLLSDHQIDHYLKLQGAFPSYEISFVIYRHGIYGIQSKYNGDVIHDLTTRTYYALVLPLRVIWNLFERGRNYEIPSRVRRYDGDKFYHASSVLSPTMNEFILNPEGICTELNLFGLTWSRQHAGEGLSINGQPMKSFPIIVFQETNYRDWTYNPEGPILVDEIPF